MSFLSLSGLLTVCMMAGVPPVPAAEGAAPDFTACMAEITRACEPNDLGCIETGRAACALLHSDPYGTRANGGANLRNRLFSIDAPGGQSRLMLAPADQASSLFIVNPDAN